MAKYDPIRVFQCAVKGCKAETAVNIWYGDGWLITGLNDTQAIDTDWHNDRGREPFHATNTARQIMEYKKKIKKTELAVALICPAHKDQVVADLLGILAEFAPEYEKDPVKFSDFILDQIPEVNRERLGKEIAAIAKGN